MNITYIAALIERTENEMRAAQTIRAAGNALANLRKNARKVDTRGMLKADRDFIARLGKL